jgi:competence protein ComEA
MKTGRPFNGWVLAVIVPALFIIAGGAVIFNGLQRSPGIEITLSPQPQLAGNIIVSGGVNNPGLYPVFSGDSFDDIIRSAGGLKDGADWSNIRLSVSDAPGGAAPQKININRAETWLLEALPGIGETRAKAVIAYREQHGLFHDIYEISNVPGFGAAIIGQIKDYITVDE